MGFSSEGSKSIERHLEDLEKAIDQYYGMINLIKRKIKPKPDEIYKEPEPLLIYELCIELGVQRVSGGLEDQPYIWMLERTVARNRSELHKQLFDNSTQEK